MTAEVIKTIENIAGASNVKTDEPLSSHTTFKIGGMCDCYVCAENEEVLCKLLDYLKKIDMPFYILGNGSNLLVKDKGFRGAIITLTGDFLAVKVEGNHICAGAGASMARVGGVALANSLTGFEFASGIPGSVGGGIIMNAGAYGGELKDVTLSVRAMDYEGNILDITCADMKFGYRTSILKNRPYIVLSALFELQTGNECDIREKMKELAQKRKDKQPLEYPSAGSTFKRPEGYFAGKLIEDSGLSGYSVGGACVSPKHNGFVINTGGATAEDVLTLMENVRNTVNSKFGVVLEPEVIVLGE